DLKLTFPLVLDATAVTNSSYQLVAWAGDSSATCTDRATRSTPGTSTQTCWPIINGAISKSATVNLTIPLRDLISQFGPQPKEGYGGPYGENTCHNSNLPSGPTTINLWFFMVGGDGNSAGNAAQFPLSVDL